MKNLVFVFNAPNVSRRRSTAFLLAGKMLLLLLSTNLQAQSNMHALWLRHACGYMNGTNMYAGNTTGDVVAADPFGNIYNAGNFSGTHFTMDSVITMNNHKVHISKFLPTGIRLWTVKCQGNTANFTPTLTRMVTDDVGNFYLCGTFYCDDSIQLNQQWYPIQGGFVAKFDSTGQSLWCKYVKASSTTNWHPTSMTVVDQAVYICGNMNVGTVDIDNISWTTNLSKTSTWMKLDLNGNVLHQEMLDPSATHQALGIAVSPTSHRIYLCGEYLSDMNVDATVVTPVSNATNSFLLCMDSTFNTQWIKTGTTHFPSGGVNLSSPIRALRKILVDDNDQIYGFGNGIGDTTRFGNLQFTHNLNNGYGQDIYVIKWNSNGNPLWLRHGGSLENDQVHDAILDAYGNVTLSVFSGWNASSGLTFGTYTINQNYGGLVKYDSNGSIIYVKQLQQGAFLKQLALSVDSTFAGTGTGVLYTMPYDTLQPTTCENANFAQSNVQNKMAVVLFLDKQFASTSPLSTSSPDKVLEFTVFPNPTEQKIQIRYSGTDAIQTLRLYSMKGELLQQWQDVKQTNFDVSHLPRGVYSFQAISKMGNRLRTTFVKQ